MCQVFGGVGGGNCLERSSSLHCRNLWSHAHLSKNVKKGFCGFKKSLKLDLWFVGPFTQDAQAHLDANYANPLMLLASCVITPIDHNVFHNLCAHVARCSVFCANSIAGVFWVWIKQQFEWSLQPKIQFPCPNLFCEFWQPSMKWFFSWAVLPVVVHANTRRLSIVLGNALGLAGTSLAWARNVYRHLPLNAKSKVPQIRQISDYLAPCTLDAMRDARRDAKKWSQVPFCCLLHHALLLVCSVNNPIATIGFVRPNLLRFSRRVWCAWGLYIGSLPHRFPQNCFKLGACFSILGWSGTHLFCSSVLGQRKPILEQWAVLLLSCSDQCSPRPRKQK